MTYEIHHHHQVPEIWEVVAVENEKAVYIAQFGGIGAEDRAREYVALMEVKRDSITR
jgi:hypothetical protein